MSDREPQFTIMPSPVYKHLKHFGAKKSTCSKKGGKKEKKKNSRASLPSLNPEKCEGEDCIKCAKGKIFKVILRVYVG